MLGDFGHSRVATDICDCNSRVRSSKTSATFCFIAGALSRHSPFIKRSIEALGWDMDRASQLKFEDLRSMCKGKGTLSNGFDGEGSATTLV